MCSAFLISDYCQLYQADFSKCLTSLNTVTVSTRRFSNISSAILMASSSLFASFVNSMLSLIVDPEVLNRYIMFIGFSFHFLMIFQFGYLPDRHSLIKVMILANTRSKAIVVISQNDMKVSVVVFEPDMVCHPSHLKM